MSVDLFHYFSGEVEVSEGENYSIIESTLEEFYELNQLIGKDDTIDALSTLIDPSMTDLP